MKKSFAFLSVLLLLGATFVMGQPAGKKFELGTSVAFFSLKFDADEGDTMTYLNVPVRFGWFVWKGLEVEPEIHFFFPMGDTGGDTSYFLQAHLLYNFKVPGQLVPFLGGGYGIGNGLPIFGVIEGSSGTRSSAFTGIAGVKYLIGNVAALRAEYRFNRFRWDDDFMLEPEHGTMHNFLVGLSVFF